MIRWDKAKQSLVGVSKPGGATRIVSTRRDKLAQHNYWDELIAMRDGQRERAKDAIQVVRGDELPQENNALGLVKWYAHPAIDDTILSTLMFFEQELPPRSRSGRLKFQGGQVMYILAGTGYTRSMA